VDEYQGISNRSPHDNGDVAVTVTTALVCPGDTQADALQAAADLSRAAPHLQITSLAWAKTPGHADGVWQWQVTAADAATGEHPGAVSRIDRRGDL
jgi:hypothetical protein